MRVRVTAEPKFRTELQTFLRRLNSPALQQAGALGLNEHAHEQRRQSITRITAITALPRSRVAGPIRVKRAVPGPSMEAQVHVADAPMTLAEYGNPYWVRDMSPGRGGGAVSSMAGAEVTAWGKRRQHRGSWTAKGQVWKRSNYSDPRSRPKRLWGVILAHELAKPTWKNVAAASRFAALDLEKRVTRHIIRALGT